MSEMKRELKGRRIGIELISGERMFGTVVDWSEDVIWIIKDGENFSKDVPRDIIKRALVLISEVCDEEQ